MRKAKIVCDACWFHHVGKNDYACLHIIPMQSGHRKKETNEVPVWCPLKIKYSFPYHIDKHIGGICEPKSN